MKNREEFEKARDKRSSEPAAVDGKPNTSASGSCTVASVMEEKTPSAQEVKFKIWRCPLPSCKYKNFGFRRTCKQCGEVGPEPVQQSMPTPKEKVQHVVEHPRLQEDSAVEETSRQYQERVCMLVAERDSMRADRYEAERDKERAQGRLAMLLAPPVPPPSEQSTTPKRNRWSTREVKVENLLAQVDAEIK